jgi:hypothetical protein
VSGSLAGGQPQYGLADIDPKVLLASDGHGCDLARDLIRRRWDRVSRRMPAVAGALLDTPIVLEERDMSDAAAGSVFSYGLGHKRRAACDAVYFGPGSDRDRIGLHERPGLYGPGSDWRLILGPDRRPTAPCSDAQERRIAAWLELQSYWRWFLQECGNPDALRLADLYVKLLAEPIRIWLWLAYGERPSGRAEALRRGRELFPAEDSAIVAALNLQAEFSRSPETPLGELLPASLRLSSLVAARLAEEVAPEGATRVRLAWGGQDELLLTPMHRRWMKRLGEPDLEARLLPLADWRALARPEPPDETLVPVSFEPTSARRLIEAVQVGNLGAYPALQVDGLLVLASQRFPRTALRGLQCAVTDPVSFSLLAGDRVASFPEVRGWSARDWGRRAVAEHRAWLAAWSDDAEEPGKALAMLITAARAALFLDSLDHGTPELPLTAAAVIERLGSIESDAQSVAEEAGASYRDFVLSDVKPAPRTASAFRELVLRLPPYAAGRDRSR